MKEDKDTKTSFNLQDHHHHHHHRRHHLHHLYQNQYRIDHDHHREDSISYDVICDEEVSSLLSKIPNVADVVAKDIEYTGSEAIVAEISAVIDQATPILECHLGSRDRLRGGGRLKEMDAKRPILDFRKMRKRKFPSESKETKQSIHLLCRLFDKNSLLSDDQVADFQPIVLIPLRGCPSVAGVIEKLQSTPVEVGKQTNLVARVLCSPVFLLGSRTERVKNGTDFGDGQHRIGACESKVDDSVLEEFIKKPSAKYNNSVIYNTKSYNNDDVYNNNNNDKRLSTIDAKVQDTIALSPASRQPFRTTSNRSWGTLFFPINTQPLFLPVGSSS